MSKQLRTFEVDDFFCTDPAATARRIDTKERKVAETLPERQDYSGPFPRRGDYVCVYGSWILSPLDPEPKATEAGIS